MSDGGSVTLEIRLTVDHGTEREGVRDIEVRQTWENSGIPWTDLEDVFRDALRAAGYTPTENDA